MRVLAAAALVALLAGCFQPAEEETDPLLGWCPQWMQGDGQDAVEGALDASTATATALLVPTTDESGNATPLLNLDGHAFDLLRIRLGEVHVDNGTLRLQVEDIDGNRTTVLRDHRLPVDRQVQPYAEFPEDAGDVLLEAVLNPIDAQTDLHSGPLRLQWSFTGGGNASWAGEATYHYRVCGGTP